MTQRGEDQDLPHNSVCLWAQRCGGESTFRVLERGRFSRLLSKAHHLVAWYYSAHYNSLCDISFIQHLAWWSPPPP